MVAPLPGWRTVASVVLTLSGCEQALELPERVAVDNVICTDGTCVCTTDFGNCDATLDNGCETSLRADPAHCGACGHDCLGGECLDGHCQPVVMASGIDFAEQFPKLMLANGSLYTSTRSGVVRVDVDAMDADPETIVAGEVRDFAVYDTAIAWLAADDVCRAEALPMAACAMRTSFPGRRAMRVAFQKGNAFVAANSVLPNVGPTVCRTDFGSSTQCLAGLDVVAVTRLQVIADEVFFVGTERSVTDTHHVFRTDLSLVSAVASTAEVDASLTLYGDHPDQVLVVQPGDAFVDSVVSRLPLDHFDTPDILGSARLLSGYVRDGGDTAYVTLGGSLGFLGDEAPILARDTSFAGLTSDTESFYFGDLVGGRLIRLRKP